MLVYRVETPSWAYDPFTGWVQPEPTWTDTGRMFPSPYSAAQYAKIVCGRVVDEETPAQPAHGGVVDAETWEMKEEWRDRGFDTIIFEGPSIQMRP